MLAGNLSTRCLAEKRGTLAKEQSTMCKCGKGRDDQRHRLWYCGKSESLRTDEKLKSKMRSVPDVVDPIGQLVVTKFRITPRLEIDEVEYEGVAGRGDISIAAGKKVYMDGSCFDNSSRVAKAGAGHCGTRMRLQPAALRQNTGSGSGRTPVRRPPF